MSSACSAKSRSPACHQTVTSSPASCCHVEALVGDDVPARRAGHAARVGHDPEGVLEGGVGDDVPDLARPRRSRYPSPMRSTAARLTCWSSSPGRRVQQLHASWQERRPERRLEGDGLAEVAAGATAHRGRRRSAPRRRRPGPRPSHGRRDEQATPASATSGRRLSEAAERAGRTPRRRRVTRPASAPGQVGEAHEPHAGDVAAGKPLAAQRPGAPVAQRDERHLVAQDGLCLTVEALLLGRVRRGRGRAR